MVTAVPPPPSISSHLHSLENRDPRQRLKLTFWSMQEARAMCYLHGQLTQKFMVQANRNCKQTWILQPPWIVLVGQICIRVILHNSWPVWLLCIIYSQFILIYFHRKGKTCKALQGTETPHFPISLNSNFKLFQQALPLGTYLHSPKGQKNPEKGSKTLRKC